MYCLLQDVCTMRGVNVAVFYNGGSVGQMAPDLHYPSAGVARTVVNETISARPAGSQDVTSWFVLVIFVEALED